MGDKMKIDNYTPKAAVTHINKYCAFRKLGHSILLEKEEIV